MRVNKFLEPKLDVEKDIKYMIEATGDNTINNKIVKSQLLDLYYLMS